MYGTHLRNMNPFAKNTGEKMEEIERKRKSFTETKPILHRGGGEGEVLIIYNGTPLADAIVLESAMLHALIENE